MGVPCFKLLSVDLLAARCPPAMCSRCRLPKLGAGAAVRLREASGAACGGSGGGAHYLRGKGEGEEACLRVKVYAGAYVGGG
jgi:hypothetical protein